jgi:hypothetical protein
MALSSRESCRLWSTTGLTRKLVREGEVGGVLPALLVERLCFFGDMSLSSLTLRFWNGLFSSTELRGPVIVQTCFCCRQANQHATNEIKKQVFAT